MDSVNGQNIEELLQVTAGESLSNDDLKELVEQVHEDDEITVSEDEKQKELSLINLTTITEIMDLKIGQLLI